MKNTMLYIIIAVAIFWLALEWIKRKETKPVSGSSYPIGTITPGIGPPIQLTGDELISPTHEIIEAM